MAQDVGGARLGFESELEKLKHVPENLGAEVVKLEEENLVVNCDA